MTEKTSKGKGIEFGKTPHDKGIKYLSGRISQHFWDLYYKEIHKAIDIALKEQAEQIFEDIKKGSVKLRKFKMFPKNKRTITQGRKVPDWILRIEKKYCSSKCTKTQGDKG